MYMDPFKSQVSFELSLTRGLLTDVQRTFQINPAEIDRDFQTVRSRTLNEGLGFLTKTLPVLGKAVDTALLTGRFSCPTSFKRKKGTALPAFLHGLLRIAFSSDGLLKEQFDITILADIRQICYLFYKYQIPHKPKLVANAFDNFEAVERDIQQSFINVEQMSISFFAQEVINGIFKNFLFEKPCPKNGPGSVANGLKPHQRFRPEKFYPQLDELCHYSSFYYYNDRHFFDHFWGWFHLDYESHGTAKLIAVPKDSRGPRLISSEPSEFMQYQQALKRELVPFLEKHPLTRGQVNFTDQSINGKLALQASKDQKFSTLDLKEASDRLSLCLVDVLFEDTVIHKWLMNSRSSYTRHPSGKMIALKKFAPMGSALCFPIQSVVFFALIVGMYLMRGTPLHVACRKVFVYGDDIIVPTEDANEVMLHLESVGLKVNTAKSCYTGYFRESCGVDAYKGIDITPLKLKKVFSANPDAVTIASYVAFGNNLFSKGYWAASGVIQKLVHRKTGQLPVCSKNSPVLGWTTWTHKHVLCGNLRALRWDRPTQQFKMRAQVISSPVRKPRMSGWDQMVRRAWYIPDAEQNQLFGSPFDSAAFSPRYQGFKHGTWITELNM